MQDATPSKRPPRQQRKGLTSTGVRKAASKSARSRSREFALQACTSMWLVATMSPALTNLRVN